MGLFDPKKVQESELVKAVDSAAELMTEFDKFSLKKKTDEEKRQEIEQNRPKSGTTTQLYRRMKLNLDITLTLVFALSVAAATCSVVVVILLKFSWLVLGIFAALAALASLASYFSFIWYLHAPVGLTRKQYIQAGSRDEKQLDSSGRTIIGK